MLCSKIAYAAHYGHLGEIPFLLTHHSGGDGLLRQNKAGFYLKVVLSGYLCHPQTGSGG